MTHSSCICLFLAFLALFLLLLEVKYFEGSGREIFNLPASSENSMFHTLLLLYEFRFNPDLIRKIKNNVELIYSLKFTHLSAWIKWSNWFLWSNKWIPCFSADLYWQIVMFMFIDVIYSYQVSDNPSFSARLRVRHDISQLNTSVTRGLHTLNQSNHL